jgi:hypothetical protein
VTNESSNNRIKVVATQNSTSILRDATITLTYKPNGASSYCTKRFDVVQNKHHCYNITVDPSSLNADGGTAQASATEKTC